MNTKLILSTRDVLSPVDVNVLKNMYKEFVLFVLTEKENFMSNDAYHNALVFTRIELLFIVKGLEKKTTFFF